MDMKKLIAQMDAIETGKKFIAESVAPVKEYKGGTDAEKIKNWQDHIKNFDAFPKAQDDARQAAKKAQPGAKFYKTDDKPKKEGMGSIARALMQDMAVDEEGNHPLDPQGYVPRGDVPAGPGMNDPMAALKHAWKYRTDDQGRLIGRRARAELDNPNVATTGDANIAGAANAGAAPAPTSIPDQGAEIGAPPSQYDVDQAANIDSTSQAKASTPAAQQAATGTQADAAFQQANQAPAATAPATTVANWQEPGTTSAAKPGGSEMDTPAPAGITSAGQAKPAAQAATTQAGKAKPTAPAASGWQAIYQMNKDVIGANPNLIKPGQQLKMPDGSTYVVKPGDTLGKIAGGGKQAAGAQSPRPNPAAQAAAAGTPEMNIGQGATAAAAPASKPSPGVDQGGPVEENLKLIKRLAGL